MWSFFTYPSRPMRQGIWEAHLGAAKRKDDLNPARSSALNYSESHRCSDFVVSRQIITFLLLEATTISTWQASATASDFAAFCRSSGRETLRVHYYGHGNSPIHTTMEPACLSKLYRNLYTPSRAGMSAGLIRSSTKGQNTLNHLTLSKAALFQHSPASPLSPTLWPMKTPQGVLAAITDQSRQSPPHSALRL